jgi:hypothetical protein
VYPIWGVAGKGKGFARQGRRQRGNHIGSPDPLSAWSAGRYIQDGPRYPFTLALMETVWRVPLPPAVQEPFQVFVNGVPQRRGTDYEVRGRELVFDKPLAKEGRLGPLRWFSIFLGVAGTYRKNDSVDVLYEAGGRRTVVTSLPIVPPERPA